MENSRTLKDIKKIFDIYDFEMIKSKYLNEIQSIEGYIKQLEIDSLERIEEIKYFMENCDYKVAGKTFNQGSKKCILFAIKFPDGTQKENKYHYENVVDFNAKIEELKKEHKVDWSGFQFQI